MKKVILTIIVILVVAVVGCTALVFSGVYNVSTANHDNGFINWWLSTASMRSIKHHAAGIAAPALDNPAMVQEGFRHFNAMCVECHGAPGKSPGETGKGLWPKAPPLGMVAPDFTPGQLFWITKNGIKFTAMPGFGPTHSDEKLWNIVAFLEKLPNLSPEDYHQMETNTVGAASPHAH